MKKVIVIGSPGAGKSYFSKQLSALTNIPLIHMDNLYWHEDKTHITHEELVEKLNEVVATDSWLIDGNYISTMELRMKEADTIFYLDFSTELCIEGIKSRVGKKRTDIPWIEESLDEEFFQFVSEFRQTTGPQIEALLEKYSNKKIYRFASREDTHNFLKSL